MTVIIDSHVHAWPRWPYQPAVPDPATRGSIEHLLHDMDSSGVDRAVVVAARIDHNADNTDYVAAAVDRNPDRLYHFADADCRWSAEHHTAGAAARLRAASAHHRLSGISHYVGPENDGWFTSDEGIAFFGVAAELGLLVGLAASPAWAEDIRVVARTFPDLPILLHHLAGVPSWRDGTDDGLRRVLPAAELSNVFVKVSGFTYGVADPAIQPDPGIIEVIRTFYESWGPERLLWGSDSPIIRGVMTYRQALDIVRRHCAFIAPDELELVLGGNLERMLPHMDTTATVGPDG